MKTYTIHVITPVDGENTVKVLIKDGYIQPREPYQPGEHGVFVRRQNFPPKYIFIPWVNITHVEMDG